jgi:hypothetical protein
MNILPYNNTYMRANMIRFVKHFIGAVVLSLFMTKYICFLLPYGGARIDAERGIFSEVDTSVNNLNAAGGLKKIYERTYPGKERYLIGPETIVVDDDSNIYALTKGGKIVLLENLNSPNHDSADVIYADTKVVVSSVGRPLGGKFVPGTKILYFADALLGLCRVNLASEHPKIELVVSEVKTSNGSLSPILYADDVDIGKSGMVYFSDASTVSSERDPDHSYDILYAYKVDALRGIKSGRLLRYNPQNDETKILAEGIWFANGVAVDKDETFVLVCETSMFRVLKYYLSGTKQGQLEVVLDSLPGLTDGVDCQSSGNCLVAIPTTVPDIFKVLFKMPPVIAAALKSLMMMLPKQISPGPVHYGGVVEFDPYSGKAKRIFQDPKGDEIIGISAVTGHKGKAYLGSLEHDFVGVYQL